MANIAQIETFSQVKTVEELQEIQNDPIAYLRVLNGTMGEKLGAVPSLVTDAVGKALQSYGVKRLPSTTFDKGLWTGKGMAGSDLDGVWERPAEFYKSIFSQMRGIADPRLKAAFAEGAGAEGGFTVPEEFRAQIMMLTLEDAVIRPRAFTFPMGSMTTRIPTIRDTSHANSVFGGVVANWEPEAGQLPETEATFGQMALVARKLTGYTVASNEILADSAIGLEALLGRLFPAAIQFYEETAFINGTGTGEPLGVLNSPARVTVNKRAGQPAATLIYENIVDIYSRVLPRARAGMIWLAHPNVLPQLLTMALNVGTGGSAIWIQPGGAQGPVPVTIFGRPIFFTEHCQSLGTEGDIIAADWSYYVIGDRGQLSMDVSPHVRFTQDQTVWRFIERLDGRPWLDSPLTLQHGSDTYSPFVTLQTRS